MRYLRRWPWLLLLNGVKRWLMVVETVRKFLNDPSEAASRERRLRLAPGGGLVAPSSWAVHRRGWAVHPRGVHPGTFLTDIRLQVVFFGMLQRPTAMVVFFARIERFPVGHAWTVTTG